MEKAKSTPLFEAEYPLDIPKGHLKVGRFAIEAFFDAGDRQYDLLDPKQMGELLVDESVEPVRLFENPSIDEWSKSDYLRYGRWLIGILPKRDGYKSINRDIITRASAFGIGPGLRRIDSPKRFGSLSNYYKRLGAANTHRVDTQSVINNPSIRRALIDYIRSVADELGRRPTEQELIAKHDQDIKNPSLHIIARRFGSLATAIELAGYSAPYAWERDDFIQWGIKFMQANDGWVPTSRDMDYLSRKSRGPSCSATIERFGGKLVEFQRQVKDAYHEQAEELNAARQRKLEDIEVALSVGTLPHVLFDGVDSEDEIIKRYARYIVVDELVSDKHASAKIKISAMEDETVLMDGFVRSIKKINNAITPGHIESSALYLGVFDDIWPPDHNNLKNLEVEIKKRRKRKIKADKVAG